MYDFNYILFNFINVYFIFKCHHFHFTNFNNFLLTYELLLLLLLTHFGITFKILHYFRNNISAFTKFILNRTLKYLLFLFYLLFRRRHRKVSFKFKVANSLEFSSANLGPLGFSELKDFRYT